MLSINPFQGDTNTTLWTFSGSSSAQPLIGTTNPTSIKTISSPDFDWQNSGSIAPFSSGGDSFFPTNAPARYLPSAPSNNHLLTANSNGLPQITTPSGTRTISHIHLRNDATFDAVGIRVAGSALSYSASDAVSWSGQGTLPYPIGDFTVTAAAEYFYSTFGPYFAAAGSQGTPTSGGLRLVVSSTPRALVPEPKDSAPPVFIAGLIPRRTAFM